MEPELEFREAQSWELVARLRDLEGSSEWVVALCSSNEVRTVLEDWREEARAQQLVCLEVALEPVQGLPGRLRSLGTAVGLIIVPEGCGEAVGLVLDQRRSSLPDPCRVVLFASPAEAGVMQTVASHFWSYVDEVVRLSVIPAPEVGPEDVLHHLQRLQLTYNKSDREIVAAAEAGTLGADPDYALWLALLGRSDLVR